MYQCSKYNNNLNVSGKKIKQLRMKNNLSLSKLSTNVFRVPVEELLTDFIEELKKEDVV